MSDSISLLNVIVTAAIALLGFLLSVYTTRVSQQQKRDEMQNQQDLLQQQMENEKASLLAKAAEQAQQIFAQKEQLRLLGEQVEHEHLITESKLEEIRKANLTPEEMAVITVSGLPARSVEDHLEVMKYRTPYIVGTPISDPDRYFRSKDQVKEFFGRVLGPQLNCLSIKGARRSGKTSFFKLLCHPQIRQQYLTAAESQCLVMVNLNLQKGITTAEQFYHHLVLKTCEAILQHGESGEMHVNLQASVSDQYIISFFNKLQEKDWQILLFLDELETLGQSPTFNIPFFNLLRSISGDSDGKIAWVTSSYRDPATIQPNQGRQETSPFFGLFNQYITLGSLPVDEARNLIRTPAKEAENAVIYEDNDVDFLIDLAGRMPLPLQAAASLFYHYSIQGIRGSEARDETRREFSGNMNTFYRHYWERFDPNEQRVLKKIATGKDVANGENHVVESLTHYGFLIGPEEISGTAFCDWVRKYEV